MDAFISPNDTGGVMKQVDSSAVVDNIFVFTDGTDKFQWTNNRKGVYPLSQAKILAGDTADKTSILQAVLDHADIKVVELDAQQVITISGTLNANGKVIRFTNGAKFTGTATINNAVILGEDDDQLFDTTITLTNSKSGKSYFSAKWYGALGNDANNDTVALQKVLDTCVYNLTKKVFFPAGKYRIDKGIYLRKDTDGNGLTEFIENVTLEGPVAPYSGNTLEACIHSINAHSFALGLQKVKGCRIKNLAFIGPNTAPQTLSLYNIVQNPETDFAPGMRDTQFSPNAGIVVDPFSDSTCPSKYPDFTAFYTEQSRGGSTDVVIDSCVVRFFVVCYLISPTGFIQNAEKITIRDCWGDYSKVAIVTGQSQTRNVYVESFSCWGGTETVIDTKRYSSGNGCPPDVNGLNIAGGVRYLCRINSWISNGLNITNMHAELLGSLGGFFETTNGGVLRIKDSFMDLIGPMVSGTISIQAAKTQFQGHTLKFENCIIFQYSADAGLPMNFAVNNLIFDNCSMGVIPTVTSSDGHGQVFFKNCSGNYNYEFGDGQIIHGSNVSRFSNVPLSFTTKMEWHTQFPLVSLKRVKRERLNVGWWKRSKDLRLIPHNSTVNLVTINQNALEATFNISTNSDFFKFLQENDFLVTQTTDEFGNIAYASFGKVITKNLSTGDVLIKYIMKGADLVTPYYLFLYKQEILIPSLIIGDLSLGSTTITNVLIENESNSIPTGVLIYHKFLPEGTYIVSYDHATKTIALSNPATGTAAEQDFVSSDWQGFETGVPNVGNAWQIGYKTGDVITNDDFITYPDVLYWTCTKSGITATTVLPEFVATHK